jgi:Na+-driven multidrug efflux pump
MEQNQALDKNISFKMLIKFSLPTIISMIFMSIYSSVDGVFVSRLVGTNALSSVNIVMPIVLMIMAIGTCLVQAEMR